MRASERWFAWAYGLWLFGVFAYFIPAATWNPVSHFDLTRAIVEHRTLSIDAYVDNTGDRAFAGGHWYTEKAPIPSMLAVPAYAVVHASQRIRGMSPEYSVFSRQDVPAQRVVVNTAFQRSLYVCSLATAGLGTAVLGVVLFFALLRRFTPHAALFGSASVVLGTPLFAYATSFYGHAIAAAFVGVVLAILLPSRPAEGALAKRVPGGPSGGERGAGTLPIGDVVSRRGVRIAAACGVLAVGCEYLALVPVVVLGLAFLWSTPRRDLPRALLDLGAGALVPALVVGGYHWACFGAPWRTGYGFLMRAEFVRGHASGLMGLHLPTLSGVVGLLFSERRGLFLLAPFTAMAVVFGAHYAIRHRDVGPRAALAAFVALLLVNAGYYMWWGGAAAGPRHLVPVLGFLSFGAAYAWESRLRWAIFVLVLVSITNLLVLTAVGIEAPDRGNVLFDYAYRRLASGELASLSGASNLGIRLGIVRGATLGPILVWMVLGARFLSRMLSEWASAEAPAFPT